MPPTGSDAPRHIGRIVDPSVREDGELEPSVELGIPPQSAHAERDPSSEPQSQVVEPSRPAVIRLQGDPLTEPLHLGRMTEHGDRALHTVVVTEEVGAENVRPAIGDSGPVEPTSAGSVPIDLAPANSRFADAAGSAAVEPRFADTATAGSTAVESPSAAGKPPVNAEGGPVDIEGSKARSSSVDVEGSKARSSSVDLEGSNARGSSVDFEGLIDDDPEERRSLELERVGEGLLSRPIGKALAVSSKPPMSPPMVAAFGAFVGVLVVATIIAIAMRLDQTKPVVETVASSKPTATVSRIVEQQEKPPEPKRRQRTKIPGPYRVKDSLNDPQLRVVEGQIGFDPFLKSVEKAGVPLKEAYRLLIAFEKVRPLNNCSRHDKFVAAIDRASKRLKAFEYIQGAEEVFQAKESSEGLLVAEKLDLQVKRERVVGAFAVHDTGLERSVTDAALEPQLLRSMREALIGHLSLEEIERGSRVRVIVQEVTALGEFARYAGIEALEIQFPSDRKRLRVYYFNGPKSRGFYDETARAPYEGGWRTPIPNAPVTSRFNMRRMHPVLHKIMPHTGVDFGAGMGVPIGATSFGTITFIGWGGPTGNFVRVQHAEGYESGYAHMSRFAEGLKVGDKVKRLQTLGYVGSTGRSTGPHLHFTIKKDGKFIDPLSLNLDALRVLPGDEREVFLQHKAQYDAQLDAIALPAPPKSNEPAPATAAPPSEGFEEDGAVEGDSHPMAAPSAGPSAPENQPASNAAAPTKNGSALYLTDEELLRMQKSSESGEVEE